MSNTKNLLNENTIRRFMKLAEIDTLSDGFVTGLVKEAHGEEEDFEGDPTGLETGESGFEVEDDIGLGAEEPEGGTEAIFTDLAQAFAGVAKDHGVDVAVDGGDLEGEMEVEDKLLDVDVEDEAVAALPENQRRRGQMLHEERLRRQVIYEEDLRRQAVYQEQRRQAANYRHALKDEVLRRVTGRLQRESRKDAVADQLSERILKRIKDRPKK